ncbi:MAG: hypothetical protein LBD68_09720 [Zoogloeaceae bacterium]|jgi:hypothetical protein|nr:hypothetical protein [Zoogloeaceae bacterium]
MKKILVLLPPLLFGSSVLAEPPLGRLFYTPTERAAIEARKGSRAAPDAATYQGLVMRGANAITVWQDDAARLPPPEADSAQTWRRHVGGARDDLLQGGRIVVHPGK